MKQIFKRLALLPVGLLLCSWGGWGHFHINHEAVFTLPKSLRAFYFNHIEYLTQQSVAPDVRRSKDTTRTEAPRHFIDLEDYGSHPFDSLPLTLAPALARYTADTLNKYGNLPYTIQEVTRKLTEAFRRQNKDSILFYSADLGHYLGDAHVPLHTSTNYDGQKSNQKGIHALWESRLPELLGNTYHLNTAPAHRIDPVAETWNIIRHTYSLKDSVLLIEKRVREAFPKEELYEKNSDGTPKRTKFRQLIYAPAFLKAYHQALNGMVENQMKGAIREVGNFWYTAWLNAGKPDLSKLDERTLTQVNRSKLKAEQKRWKRGETANLSQASGD